LSVTHLAGAPHCAFLTVVAPYLPWSIVLNFHGFYEYYAINCGPGGSLGLGMAWKF
jgi:hypothetical protein